MKRFLSIILFIILSINSIFSVNVTPGDEICIQEKTYVQNRKQINKAAIRHFIGTNNKSLKLPKISLCCSGGGYRAMISNSGFLSAMENNNLLHSANYISTLSGSTWLLIPMLITNTTPSHYKNILENRVNLNFFNPETLNLEQIHKYLKLKNNIQPIDIWGATLADRLMGNIGDAGQNITFKAMRQNLKKTNYNPFPLFSCTIANSQKPETKLPYRWLEVNPFQTYSKALGGTIPTKYLGNVFKNGVSKSNYSEFSAGFFMGIFGSPFCMSAGDIFNFLLMEFAEFLHIRHYKFIQWFEKTFEFLRFYKKRFCPAKVPNYSLGLRQSQLRKTKQLELIDGGFNFNLPFVPIFRRKSDIIIVCDASSDACAPNYPELQLVANYAYNHHDIQFPNINEPYKKFDNLEIFFSENNPDAPMIIYFTNPIAEPTLKMEYHPEEFEKLHNAMKNLVESNKENLINAVKLKVKQLNYMV